MDIDTKKAWKIVSDPYIEEKCRLVACTILAKKALASRVARFACTLPAWLKYATAWAICLFTGYVGMRFVDTGFSWGYWCADFIHKQRPSQQDLVAHAALIFLIAPLYYAVAAGMIKQQLNFDRRWTIFCTLAASIIMVSIIVPFGLFEFLQYAWLIPLGAVLVIGAMDASKHTYRYCMPMFSPNQVFAVTLAVMSVNCVFTFMDVLPTSWVGLTMLYSGTIFIGSFLAAKIARANTAKCSMAVALRAWSPLTLINLANIFANIVALAFDSIRLGPHLGTGALISALSITVVTTASAIAGGLSSDALKFEQK